jgi:hypothetical protein
MNVVFLDIDGVLNNSCDSDLHCTTEEGGCDFYSPTCVSRLNLLTDITSASIVVSSTWRLGETVESLQIKLKIMGIKAPVIGRTEDLGNNCVRGNEILKWIKDNIDLLGVDYYHEYKNYVILDDDTDMLLWQKNNFIHTDGQRGLTWDDVELAKCIFNRGY